MVLWVAECCTWAIWDSGDHFSGTWLFLCLPGWHHREVPEEQYTSSGSSPETPWPLGTSNDWHMQEFLIKRIPERSYAFNRICMLLLSISHCVTRRTSGADSRAVRSGWIVWVSITIPLISRQQSQESLFSPGCCLSLLAALISFASASAYQTLAMSTSPYLCLLWDVGHGDVKARWS